MAKQETKRVLLAAMLIACVFLHGVANLASAAEFIPLGGISNALGVSANGSVVVGSGGDNAAFRWTPTTGKVSLGFLSGNSGISAAYGVNVDGTIVTGSSRSSSSVDNEAFRWTESAGMVGLGIRPGAARSNARGVSANGSVVVGFSEGPNGVQTEAFRWTSASGFVHLGFLPGGSFPSRAFAVSADGNVVVGGSPSSLASQEAFRYTPNGMVGLGVLSGRQASTATAISPNGSVVVGWSGDPRGTREAFRWTSAGGMSSLGFLPGESSSTVSGVSADGNVIVGGSGSIAVVWTPANGMQSLVDVLTANGVIGMNNWDLTSASAVSPDGRWIVGQGFGPSGNPEAFLADISPTVAGPRINVQPTTLDFGQLDTGQSATNTVIVTNSGTDPLDVTSVVAPLAPFLIITDACTGTSLMSGSSCSLDVQFAPLAAGTFNDQLSIDSNDTANPTVVVSLEGSAVEPPVPVVLSVTDTVSPVDDNAIDFGVVRVTDSGMATFTVSNDGTGAVTLGMISISADAGGVFSIPVGNDACSNATLNPGDTCTAEVRFVPSVVGDFTAFVDIAIASGGSLQVELSGTADLRQFDLVISKTSSVTTVTAGAGEIVEYTIIVTNNGPDFAIEPTITDFLPLYLVLAATPLCSAGSGLDGSNCFLDGQGNWNGVWILDGLAATASATATVMLTENIPANASGTCLINQVEVQAEGDTDSSNNIATSVVGGGNCADLNLTWQGVPLAVSTTKAAASFTVTATNSGPEDIAAVMVSGLADFGQAATGDTLGITSLTGCINPVPSGEDPTFVCEVGPVASGSEADIQIEAELTTSATPAPGTSATVYFTYGITISGSVDPEIRNNHLDSGILPVPINLQQVPQVVASDSGGGGRIAILTLLLLLLATCQKVAGSKGKKQLRDSGVG